jgi:glycosyltransferase involved in cell wall biosynthesis
MRVALVHDWLTGYRGGERVLHHLAKRFEGADVFTLIHEPGSVPPEIERHPIRVSWLDRIPGRARYYRALLPLFPSAIRRFDFAGYDLVLSTSHAVAKSVRIPEGVPHVDYCFTPMRYVWDHADTYLGRGKRRRLARPLIERLRRFDLATSGEDSVTRFVATSNEVADRIRRHYGRSARVVPPPVDLSWIEPARSKPEDFYLLVGGFVPYKREDIVVEAFRRLGRRLIVAGDGPQRRNIQRGAPPNVEFVGRIPEAELAELYRNSRALLYPQHEDFGLVAVEAQAAGRPVIGLGRGGLLDTVRPFGSTEADLTDTPTVADAPGPTGLFFSEQTPEAVCAAVERFETLDGALFDPMRLRRWAETFSPERFDRDLDAEIARALAVTKPQRAYSNLSAPVANDRPDWASTAENQA